MLSFGDSGGGFAGERAGVRMLLAIHQRPSSCAEASKRTCDLRRGLLSIIDPSGGKSQSRSRATPPKAYLSSTSSLPTAQILGSYKNESLACRARGFASGLNHLKVNNIKYGLFQHVPGRNKKLIGSKSVESRKSWN